MSLASLLDLKMTMSWTYLSVRSLDSKPTVTLTLTLQVLVVIKVRCVVLYGTVNNFETGTMSLYCNSKKKKNYRILRTGWLKDIGHCFIPKTLNG